MSEAESSTESSAVSEAALGDLIAERLRAILRVVQLECDGEPVEIDSFRLRTTDGGELSCGN